MTLSEALQLINRLKFDVYLSYSHDYLWECSIVGKTSYWRHSANNRTPEEAIVKAASRQPNSKRVNYRGR